MPTGSSVAVLCCISEDEGMGRHWLKKEISMSLKVYGILHFLTHFSLKTRKKVNDKRFRPRSDAAELSNQSLHCLQIVKPFSLNH